MKYEKLKSLFYQDINKWQQTYNNRLNSESSIKFNILDDNIPFFLVVTPELVNKIETILFLDKKLLITTDLLPKIALDHYTTKCLVDEIKMTNAIEGVRSTREEIINVIDTIENKKNIRLKGLVKKYLMLSENNFKLTSYEDIRVIYNELVLAEVLAENKDNAPDGSIFRSDSVHIQGNSMNILHTGINGENHIIRSIQKTIDIINNTNYSSLIKVAVTHYLIGYIHPFYDGNGRLMRYISSSLLAQNLQNIVGYRLSYVLKQNIDTYMKLFKETNEENNKRDLTLFTLKFFDFIIIAINDLIDTLEEKSTQLKYYTNQINKIYNDDLKTNSSNLAFILVQDSLFGESGLDVNLLSQISNLGNSTTRIILKELELKELIIKNKKGNKYLYSICLDKLSKI